MLLHDPNNVLCLTENKLHFIQTTTATTAATEEAASMAAIAKKREMTIPTTSLRATHEPTYTQCN